VARRNSPPAPPGSPLQQENSIFAEPASIAVFSIGRADLRALTATAGPINGKPELAQTQRGIGR